MAESLERCFSRALLKHFPSEDGDTDEEFHVSREDKERKDKKRNRSSKHSGPESLIRATEQVQRKRNSQGGKGSTPSVGQDSKLARPPGPPHWTNGPVHPHSLPPSQLQPHEGGIRGMYHPVQQLHHLTGPPGSHGPHVYAQRMAMDPRFAHPIHIPRHGDHSLNRLPHSFNMQHHMADGHHMGHRYPMRPDPNEQQPPQQHLYMGPTHGPSLGPRPMGLQPGPPPEASMYPSHHHPEGHSMHPVSNKFSGPKGPPQHSYPDLRPPGIGVSNMWPNRNHQEQDRLNGMRMQDPNIMSQRNFNYGGIPPPVGHKPWPEAAGYPKHPSSAQYQMSAVASSLGPMSSRPPVPQPDSSGRPGLSSMLESPEMLAMQQLSASSGPPATTPPQHMGSFQQPEPPSGLGSIPTHPCKQTPHTPEVQLLHSARDKGPDNQPSQKTDTDPKGTTSVNKIPTHISEEGSLHKNIFSMSQDHSSISSPVRHYNRTADGMQSSPGPNLSRSQENPSGPGLSQCSSDTQNHNIDGQGLSASHCPPQNNSATNDSSHINTTNISSTEHVPHNPPKHAQDSPQHKAQSPVHLLQNLTPLHVSESQNSIQHLSENKQNGHQESEHQQSIQKQPSQATQSTLPESHSENSPQPMKQNTEQHSSLIPSHPTLQRISPQCPSQSNSIYGMPRSITQAAQPAPPQPAPFTSLPPSHPAPLLPSQPSPADRGDQRPSEPTSRPHTDGTSIAPKQTMMTPGPPASIYEHQAFSPNHNQTQAVGSNVAMQSQNEPSQGHNPAIPPHSQGQINGAMGQYGMNNPPHSHYNQSRPMPPSSHHPYHNQPLNALRSHAPNPAYHQQGGTAYSYNMLCQQHPQAHNNIYPPHQYQQESFYPQSHPQNQPHNQSNGRRGYPSKEWHCSVYQPQHPVLPSAYLPAARAKGHSKESSASPLGSDGSCGTGMVSPGSVAEVGPQSAGTEEGECESRNQSGTCNSTSGSPAKQGHNESSEQPESPKEILDLDSHNAVARNRSIQPLQHQHPPVTAAQMTSGFIYDPRSLHPGMHQGGIPPPHMSQGCALGNGNSYPGQPYPDPGRYATQRPLPHLMEALQRPQQLPYSPGQTRMAMYRHLRPTGQFQGMMIQQRGLRPELFLHPGQQMMVVPGTPRSKQGL